MITHVYAAAGRPVNYPLAPPLKSELDRRPPHVRLAMRLLDHYESFAAGELQFLVRIANQRGTPSKRQSVYLWALAKRLGIFEYPPR